MRALRWGLAGLTLAIGLLADGARLAPVTAEAAQPWTCICNGAPKRNLASTRHCENKFGLPKGQSCNWWQWRKVYAPACRESGCYLPWRH